MYLIGWSCMSLTHLCSQINSNLQQHASPVTHAVPTAVGSALAEYRVDPTQQAHFHWLLSLAQARTGLAEMNVMHSQEDSNNSANSDPHYYDPHSNALATAPVQPLAASNERLQAIKHTATALANGDIANMHLLQLMHPHPLSLRNNPDYIDDDILDNGVFLREQVTLNQQALHPELLHDLYVKNETKAVVRP